MQVTKGKISPIKVQPENDMHISNRVSKEVFQIVTFICHCRSVKAIKERIKILIQFSPFESNKDVLFQLKFYQDTHVFLFSKTEIGADEPCD